MQGSTVRRVPVEKIERMSLNLLSDPWIPVRRDGARAVIRPAQIAESGVSGLDWPRDDLNLAGLELLVGLMFLTDPPRNDADWRERYDRPDPERLDAALAPFAPFFEITGTGPRFLQDLEPFEGSAKERDIRPPDLLFIDSAGKRTAALNADLMVHRARYRTLPLPLAAMALYTLQAFAPVGGVGHRTSMRGGGPLVTLVRPTDGGACPLWRSVWANVPDGEPVAAEDAGDALPWLRPTRTSEDDQVVTAAMSHAAEAFFGMPRRIRLVLEDGAVTGVVQKTYGTNYSGWIHPLSPHYRTRPEAEWRPGHPGPRRASYRDCPGLSFGADGDTRRIAAAVSRFHARPDAPPCVVEAGGWVMNKMKPLDFVRHAYPAFRLDAGTEVRVRRLVDAANAAVRELGTALSGAGALTGPAAHPVFEEFFADTERGFIDAAGRVSEGGGGGEVEHAWTVTLRRAALALFDRHAMPGLPDRNFAEVRRAVLARRFLLEAFASPDGIREILGLPPAPAPEARPTDAPAGPGAVGAAWWRRTLNDGSRAGRLARARLRRCPSPADAVAIEAVHDLARQLGDAGHPAPPDRLTLIAVALAHAPEQGPRHLADVLGRRPYQEAPRALSALRWQLLVQTARPLDLVAPLARAMAAVRRVPVHVGALAGDLHRWDDATRTRWCCRYFGAGAAAPEPEPEVTDA